MKKLFIFLLLFPLLCSNSNAQQTVGLFTNTTEAFDGYTLFAANNSNDIYLIDKFWKSFAVSVK